MPSANGHGPQAERMALYLRVSSEEQRDAGTIQTQRDYLERYVAEPLDDAAERGAFESVASRIAGRRTG